MDNVDPLAFDQIDHPLNVSVHDQWVFRGDGQSNMFGMDPGQIVHQQTAFRCDQSPTAGSGDGTGNLHRTPLNAATATKGRQYLQHGRLLPALILGACHFVFLSVKVRAVVHDHVTLIGEPACLIKQKPQRY